MATNTIEKKLVLLDTDASRLRQLLNARISGTNQYCAALKEEILKADVVSRPDLPEDVVVMHSTVEIQDMEEKESAKYTLVYPSEADIDSCKISILAPIGTAIIGYRQGDEILWKVPGGIRRLKIAAVVQPHDNQETDLLNKS